MQGLKLLSDVHNYTYCFILTTVIKILYAYTYTTNVVYQSFWVDT